MSNKLLRRQFRIGLVCLLLCSCFVTAGHKEKLCELAKQGQLSDELISVYYQYALGNAKEKIPTSKEFWSWLSRNKVIERGLLVGLDPEYNPHVVTNLQELRKKFGTKVEQYPHLALAFSFVYGAAKDKSIRHHWIRWVNVASRKVPSCRESFGYYMDNKDKMVYRLNELSWPMLLYVADNDVPLAERQWVLDRYAGRPITKLGRLHNEPVYRTGTSPVEIPKILQEGATCYRLAYFSYSVLKSLGVPAYKIGGPGHVYEGWIVKGEKLTAKIGESLGLRNGGVLCPLTRKIGREYEIRLLTSAIDLSYERYLKSKIACYAYKILPDDSKKQAVGSLEAAMENNPYVPESWLEYAQLCADGDLQFSAGWKLFDRANGVVSECPELACIILNKLTAGQLKNGEVIPDDQYKRTRNCFRETLRRLHKKKRIDLGLSIFKTHASYLARTKGVDDVVDNSLEWFKLKKFKLSEEKSLFTHVYNIVRKSNNEKALEKLLRTEYRRRLLETRKGSKKLLEKYYSCCAQVARVYVEYLKKTGNVTKALEIHLELDKLKDENPKLADLRDVISQGRKLGAIDQQVAGVKMTDARLLVWRILYDLPRGTNVRLRMEHAKTGKEGAFYFVAWADKNGDGVPDTQIGTSSLMMVKNKGGWSDWEFVSDGKTVFVGIATKKNTPIYYQMGGELEGYYGLSDRVFYSRKIDQSPVSSAQPRYTNMRIEILGK